MGIREVDQKSGNMRSPEAPINDAESNLMEDVEEGSEKSETSVNAEDPLAENSVSHHSPKKHSIQSQR